MGQLVCNRADVLRWLVICLVVGVCFLDNYSVMAQAVKSPGDLSEAAQQCRQYSDASSTFCNPQSSPAYHCLACLPQFSCIPTKSCPTLPTSESKDNLFAMTGKSHDKSCLLQKVPKCDQRECFVCDADCQSAMQSNGICAVSLVELAAKAPDSQPLPPPTTPTSKSAPSSNPPPGYDSFGDRPMIMWPITVGGAILAAGLAVSATLLIVKRREVEKRPQSAPHAPRELAGVRPIESGGGSPGLQTRPYYSGGVLASPTKLVHDLGHPPKRDSQVHEAADEVSRRILQNLDVSGGSIASPLSSSGSMHVLPRASVCEASNAANVARGISSDSINVSADSSDAGSVVLDMATAEPENAVDAASASPTASVAGLPSAAHGLLFSPSIPSAKGSPSLLLTDDTKDAQASPSTSKSDGPEASPQVVDRPGLNLPAFSPRDQHARLSTAILTPLDPIVPMPDLPPSKPAITNYEATLLSVAFRNNLLASSSDAHGPPSPSTPSMVTPLANDSPVSDITAAGPSAPGTTATVPSAGRVRRALSRTQSQLYSPPILDALPLPPSTPPPPELLSAPRRAHMPIGKSPLGNALLSSGTSVLEAYTYETDEESQRNP